MSGPTLFRPDAPGGERRGRASPLLPSREVLEALDLVLSKGRVELQPLPGGERGELMVEVGGHVVILHPRRRGIRVVSQGVDRARRWCARLSGLGAVLLGTAWVMVGVSILVGASLRPGTLVGTAAVILFILPLGLSLPLSRRVVEVDPEQEIPGRVEAALRSALELEATPRATPWATPHGAPPATPRATAGATPRATPRHPATQR